jgi:hypothetical protein
MPSPPVQAPAYQPPAYQSPMNQVAYAQPMQMQTTNGLAIASMVLGICWVWWIGSLLALIFGFVARKQIKARNQKGEGMAIAGIVLGFIGAATLIIVIILAAAATHNPNPQY